MAAAEIAQALGLGSARIYQIMKSDPTFPEPIATLRVGKIWLATDIEEWMRRTGRAPARPAAESG
ncbi:hypothetical protein CcI156_10870 [Frankia sp. CcI156]|nr:MULTISPECIES: AlpA family phage regulatory protein [Frankia]ETA02429.1 hypothetical protein CcI6DRAFT_02224 [Frankia sp. CcI6]KFB04703.1 Prophage CP4-57 regulatory protein (AlpA) [Frankia sp. Allo2]OAA25061.1 Prophage CP4-57 regulatory protein (AlpA) [Frankia casuarinae]ONH26272.1 hypothetical protein CcI156_10870 [Frankia sp. CcI156]TFE28782.1 AlpA family phage regulatory protein [Frankia sp. B2]